MGAREIYSRLRATGLTHEGACGLMGNMQAESAMRANNAQDGMTGLTDAEYTAAADAGTIDFVRDATGYGLCQWTYCSRKQALLDFARARRVSVGDEAMQVDFCIHELRNDYPALFTELCESNSVYDCAARVCREYERPAVDNSDLRAAYAQGFYNWLNTDTADSGGNHSAAGVNTDDLKTSLTNESVMHLQAILASYGYDLGTSLCSSGVDGLIGKKTVSALKDFAARLEAIV